jgi:hypothetical protein
MKVKLGAYTYTAYEYKIVNFFPANQTLPGRENLIIPGQGEFV